jgi:hypothetical protein
MFAMALYTDWALVSLIVHAARIGLATSETTCCIGENEVSDMLSSPDLAYVEHEARVPGNARLHASH